MVKAEKKKIDMTEGTLFGKIVVFVLPMILTNLLQVTYNAADMMVVSLSNEPNAVGAIGATGSFINLVLNIFVGFATGANVVVAHRLGAKDGDGASKSTHTALLLGVILGFLSSIIGISITRPVISLMGAEGNLLDLAVKYATIYFMGTPFIALSNYTVAIFRSKGDTKTPLYILTFSGLLNVAFNLFFVLIVGMSVEGVAIATLIANATSTVLLLWRLSKDDGPCKFSFKKLKIDRRALKSILHIGIPAGIQGSLFSLSNIIIQSSILTVNDLLAPGSAYAPVVEGNAAMSNLEGFMYTATNSVCQASVAFTSQNVGAGKYDRVKKVMLNCYAITFIVAIVFMSILFVFNKPLLSLYGVVEGAEGSLERIAYDTAMIKLIWQDSVYFLLAFMEVGSGVLRGLGRSLASTVISLIGSCLLRIVWISTVFNKFLNVQSIYISYPLSWGLTAVILLIYIIFVLRKEKRRAAMNLAAQPL